MFFNISKFKNITNLNYSKYARQFSSRSKHTQTFTTLSTREVCDQHMLRDQIITT